MEERADLSPLRMAELAEEERIRSAEKWREVNSQLWDESVALIRKNLSDDMTTKLEEKRKELTEGVYREFAELMKQYGKEIEVYSQNSTDEKREKFEFLLDNLPKLNKRRQARNLSAQTETVSPFDEDMKEIVTELINQGVEVDKTTRLADGCMMYNGKVVSVGDPLLIETRVQGRSHPATISAVTTSQLVVTFKDSTRLSIHLDDLLSKRVVLSV